MGAHPADVGGHRRVGHVRGPDQDGARAGGTAPGQRVRPVASAASSRSRSSGSAMFFTCPPTVAPSGSPASSTSNPKGGRAVGELAGPPPSRPVLSRPRPRRDPAQPSSRVPSSSGHCLSSRAFVAGRLAEVDPAGQVPGSCERVAQSGGEVLGGRERRDPPVTELVDAARQCGGGVGREQVAAADGEGGRSREPEGLGVGAGAHFAADDRDLSPAQLVESGCEGVRRQTRAWGSLATTAALRAT